MELACPSPPPVPRAACRCQEHGHEWRACGRKGEEREQAQAWAQMAGLLSPFSDPCSPSTEIEAIKLAEQKLKAERKRRATVVVGDLQPLRDALPELLDLEAVARRPQTRG